MTGRATPSPAGLRTGFTTGACAAAAARAAARFALGGEPPAEVEITLPNGKAATFRIARAERRAGAARCAVVKDAGDDPDVTHGAEIIAEVELAAAPGVEIRGGEGVATVTKPGLGLEVGAPAINPAPRRNIAAMVAAELAGTPHPGARVTISVPRGEALARRTMNARLGLVGGISILGTTGIVRPFSAAAWVASVAAAIDVACAQRVDRLILATGARTERAAMALWPALPADAFVQVGDAVGSALRHAAGRGAREVEVVAMVGKMTKLAAGALQTHVSRAEVSLPLLAEIAGACGAAAPVQGEIAAANTARQALDVWRREGLAAAAGAELCRRAAERCGRAAPRHRARLTLVGFEGELLGRHPPGEEAR